METNLETQSAGTQRSSFVLLRPGKSALDSKLSRSAPGISHL